MSLFKLAAAGAAMLACAGAAASPMAAHYTGTVDAVSGPPPLHTDFRVGDRFEWRFEFDDHFSALPPSDAAAAVDQAVSGWARIGDRSYLLDHLGLDALYDGGGSTSYAMRVAGSGPDTDQGGVFTGLTFVWNGTLDAASAVRAAFAYDNAAGAAGVLLGDGNFTLEPASGPPTSVPVPATAWLLAAPLGWLMRRRIGARA